MVPISLSGKIEIGAIINLFCLSQVLIGSPFNVWTIILRLWRPVRVFVEVNFKLCI